MAYQLLKGKRGIIFGALDKNSISWKAAERIKEEGGSFILTNTPVALKLGTLTQLAASCNTKIIPADATSITDLEGLIQQSLEILGGKLDFVLHTPAMSPNVRKNRSYGDLNYDWFMKTLDVSAISFHKFMQTAEKLEAMNEYGSILALSYIAAQRTFSAYSDMAQAKAMLESIARSYGERFAKQKVRVNTISQSPVKTTAGNGVPGFDTFYEYAEKISPLGNASSEDCAAYITIMFSDLSRMVTMQNLMHDGGFSTTGITDAIVKLL